MSKRVKDPDTFNDEYVKKNRTFPKRNAVLIVICVIAQILAISFAVAYKPVPQDIIKEYSITVEPRDDGSLDIEYTFEWNAIDTGEDLTWVDIGMPNANFDIYKSSLSPNIRRAERYTDGAYVSTRIYFDRAYRGGSTAQFSFKVNQRNMLHSDGNKYYYVFIPGWFNSTPVEHYTFKWKASSDILAAGTSTKKNGYYIWEGRMDTGKYVTVGVSYKKSAFDGAHTVTHIPFDAEGVYDELGESKESVVVVAILAVLALGIAEMYIVDSFVSYHRGRGFITGYGYHVHVYGRTNPRYIRARNNYTATQSSSRSGGGRGCACACACACAGGGRAGCSQKDTYSNKKKDEEKI